MKVLAEILIVEDEVKLSRFIELELVHEGYGTKCVHDGINALELALSGDYDLIILDLMLPGMSGIEICRRVRRTSNIPIIILTAKDDISDKVSGLDTGADDYMTKPFAIEELLARIRTALKRKVVSADRELLTIGALQIDPAARRVTFDSVLLDLTKKEYDLLEYLAQNENTVLTRNQLLDKVWGYEYLGDTNVVDVYIRYLRSKIDQHFNIKLIRTVRGVGYTLRRD